MESPKESTESEGECLRNLRHGKYYPERQMPKEKKKKGEKTKKKKLRKAGVQVTGRNPQSSIIMSWGI